MVSKLLLFMLIYAIIKLTEKELANEYIFNK